METRKHTIGYIESLKKEEKEKLEPLKSEV